MIPSACHGPTHSGRVKHASPPLRPPPIHPPCAPQQSEQQFEAVVFAGQAATTRSPHQSRALTPESAASKSTARRKIRIAVTSEVVTSVGRRTSAKRSKQAVLMTEHRRTVGRNRAQSSPFSNAIASCETEVFDVSASDAGDKRDLGRSTSANTAISPDGSCQPQRCRRRLRTQRQQA